MVANQDVKHHRSPLHILIHAFGIIPQDTETIDAYRHHLKWKRECVTSITASKDEVEEAEATKKTEVRGYSDKSGIDSRIRASVVLYCRSSAPRKLHFYLGSIKHHMVCKGKLVGLLLAAELLRTEPGRRSSMIGSDS